jgi:uncharacterized protein YjaZ
MTACPRAVHGFLHNLRFSTISRGGGRMLLQEQSLSEGVLANDSFVFEPVSLLPFCTTQ